jgi:hypothetical protein
LFSAASGVKQNASEIQNDNRVMGSLRDYHATGLT